jgi:hypothetical protein
MRKRVRIHAVRMSPNDGTIVLIEAMRAAIRGSDLPVVLDHLGCSVGSIRPVAPATSSLPPCHGGVTGGCGRWRKVGG